MDPNFASDANSGNKSELKMQGLVVGAIGFESRAKPKRKNLADTDGTPKYGKSNGSLREVIAL